MIWKSRLELDGVSLGFSTLLPISTNVSVADIREPGKSKGPYTKTISIPASPETQRFFEYAHNTNVESNDFNANLAVEAKYFVNEVMVYNGKLQLVDTKIQPGGAIYYECSMIGETGNVFLAIAGLYLHDIDMSDLDHAFTYGAGLFAPTLGEGYAYGYIDYGVNPLGSRVGRQWTFEHLKPLIFEREYLLRMFADAGYAIAGNYIDSTYAKSIVIPDVNAGALQLPAATVTDNQFLARISSLDNNNIPLTPGTTWVASNFVELMEFDDDSSSGYFDPGGVYDTSNFIFEPAVNATFQITGTMNLFLSGTPPAGTTNVTASYLVFISIQKSINSGGSWTTESTYSETVTNATSTTATYTNTVTIPPTLVTQPAIFRVIIGISNIQIVFKAGIVVISAGTASLDFNYSGTFGAIIASANLPSGATVVMNDTIPRDYLQLDFLTSIIKEEHLFIEPDKENSRTYIIEPRENFILDTDPLDWTNKWDQGKETKVTPMGELDAKQYVFTRTSDKDYYNELYEKEFKEVYGCKKVDTENEFAKGVREIKSIFSSTPIAAASDLQPSTDIVAPRLLKMDDQGTVSPLKCNIRRLYWGGMINCDSHYLITSGYASSSGYTGPAPIKVTQYPFVGHVDHPMNPTINIDFNFPQRLYWIFPNQTFTNDGRYNTRYSKYLYEITHRDSKVVTMYMNLNAIDIASFSFRKQVFVKDTYYFVNEIKDYDPQEQKSIPVEMLKLKKGPIFTAVIAQNLNDWIGGGDMNSARTGPNVNARGNYGVGQSVGTNNINNSPYTLVIGNNNYVQ